MRPTQDLAYRARNWFWYWRVRQISGLTNEELDKKCFGNQGRRRHFERIEASASDPDDMPLLDGRTLVEIVDAWDRPEDGGPGPYACATRAYQSTLWSFLAIRDQAPAIYSDFIQEHAEARGWMRVHDRDYSLYAMCLGSEEPAIERRVGTAYSAMLHKLVNEPSPDATAILIALFREAIHQVHLDNAFAIRKALPVSIMSLGDDIEIPQYLTRLIWHLAHDRVLSNQWVTEADWRRSTNRPFNPKIDSRARIREFRDWVHWYTHLPKGFGRSGFGRYPLVPKSARTEWLEEHRHALEEVCKEIAALRQMHQDLQCSWEPTDLDRADRARTRADVLLSHISPPKVEPERFYSCSPNLEMPKLPPPYPRSRRQARD